MNIHLVLLLVLAPLLTLNSQTHDFISVEDASFAKTWKDTKRKPIVKGKIFNLKKGEAKNIKISYTLYTPFRKNHKVKSCTLSKDNTFEITLDYALPYQQIYFVIHDLIALTLYVNSDLYVSVDARRKDEGYKQFGFRFSGTDAEANYYMDYFRIYKNRTGFDFYSAISKALKNKNIDRKTAHFKIDSIIDVEKNIHDTYFKDNPSVYTSLVENERKSKICNFFLSYYRQSKMSDSLFNTIRNHKPYIISSESNEYYKNLFNYISHQSNLIISLKSLRTYSKLSESQKNTIDSLLTMIDAKIQKKPFNQEQINNLRNTVNTFPADSLIIDLQTKQMKILDTVFDSYKSDMIKFQLMTKDAHLQKDNLEALQNHISTPWVKAVLKSEYIKSIERIATMNSTLKQAYKKPNKSIFKAPVESTDFGADLYVPDNVDYLTLLASIKHKFPQKALLIDFWARWCPGCRSEMPHSKELREKTQKLQLPVEMVYISTSDRISIDEWKSAIKKYELSGTHIYIDNSIMNDFHSFFDLRGYPNAIFLNIHGMYTSSERRPIRGWNIPLLKQKLQ